MPRVTLFKIVTGSSDSYGYDIYELYSPGAEVVEVTEDELKKLEKYCQRTRKYLLCVEDNKSIQLLIENILKEEEKYRKENESRIKAEEERREKAKQKKLEKERKKFEELKKKFENKE